MVRCDTPAVAQRSSRKIAYVIMRIIGIFTYIKCIIVFCSLQLLVNPEEPPAANPEKEYICETTH